MGRVWNPTIGEWVDTYGDEPTGNTAAALNDAAGEGTGTLPPDYRMEGSHLDPNAGLSPAGPGYSVGGNTSSNQGAPPSGFGSWAEYEQWRDAFAREHGGQTPEQYYGSNGTAANNDAALNAAAADRMAGMEWAAQHGNPSSWGNASSRFSSKYGQVPLEIWQRLRQAKLSNVGTRGPSAWVDAADDIGGAVLAMQGQSYHPTTAAAATETGSGKTAATLASFFM
jgi:hypothetical protein